MNVIGHQHAGVHHAAMALSVMLDPLEINDSLAFVAKISVSDFHERSHMLQSAFKFDSRLARHSCLYL
jgi:hypothetical protein